MAAKDYVMMGNKKITRFNDDGSFTDEYKKYKREIEGLGWTPATRKLKIGQINKEEGRVVSGSGKYDPKAGQFKIKRTTPKSK